MTDSNIPILDWSKVDLSKMTGVFDNVKGLDSTTLNFAGIGGQSMTDQIIENLNDKMDTAELEPMISKDGFFGDWGVNRPIGGSRPNPSIPKDGFFGDWGVKFNWPIGGSRPKKPEESQVGHAPTKPPRRYPSSLVEQLLQLSRRQTSGLRLAQTETETETETETPIQKNNTILYVSIIGSLGLLIVYMMNEDSNRTRRW